MVFIPLITVFVYPKVVTLARPLVRLGTGLALSSVTFLIVAFLQYRLEGGASMSIAWQLIPYCVLTIPRSCSAPPASNSPTRRLRCI